MLCSKLRVWPKIWIVAFGGTDGMGGEMLNAAAISVHVVVNCTGWFST